MAGTKRKNKKKQTRKPKDATQSEINTFNKLEDPQPTDFIIPIMGPTGVGKSTFINTAIGAKVAEVGDDLESCTSTLQHYIIPGRGSGSRRIILVDTPGFDDTYVDDREILRRVGVWLGLSYKEDMTLAGVIYLHEISQTRMLGSSRKNFTMFNKLCGVDAAKSVVLVTTKWTHVESGVGVKREKQLSETHWKSMIEQGSGLGRFLDTKESALAIIDSVLAKTPQHYPEQEQMGHILQIQDELIELQKRIPTTDSGTYLRNVLQELLKDQKEKAKQLKGLTEDAEVQEQLEETERRIRSTLEQIKQLKVPLSARIMAVFFP